MSIGLSSSGGLVSVTNWGSLVSCLGTRVKTVRSWVCDGSLWPRHWIRTHTFLQSHNLVPTYITPKYTDIPSIRGERNVLTQSLLHRCPYRVCPVSRVVSTELLSDRPTRTRTPSTVSFWVVHFPHTRPVRDVSIWHYFCYVTPTVWSTYGDRTGHQEIVTEWRSGLVGVCTRLKPFASPTPRGPLDWKPCLTGIPSPLCRVVSGGTPFLIHLRPGHQLPLWWVRVLIWLFIQYRGRWVEGRGFVTIPTYLYVVPTRTDSY